MHFLKAREVNKVSACMISCDFNYATAIPKWNHLPFMEHPVIMD